MDRLRRSIAFLHTCYADCPQHAAQLTLLSDDERALRQPPDPGSDLDSVLGNLRCDNKPTDPISHAISSHSSVHTAGWYRFDGAAGGRMLTSPPGERRCSSEAAGWLRDEHPRAGDAPQPSTVCSATASTTGH